jgi:aryl-alcohol dehydrogenase (NADP+)
MDYVNLGRTGLKVSRICLGCMSYGASAWRDWVLDEEPSRPFFRRAIEHGITFFDTADMYSLGMSEEVTGRALRDFAKRDQVVIATKAFYPVGPGPNDRGLSRKHLFDAIDASLRRLGTDYVDLYQIHRLDPFTPIDETLRALEDIVRAGKARYIGASSMFAWQFAKALALADARGWTRFVSMQNHYNLVYREEEREMIPLCVEEGVGIIPWSPLARGFLAGNRRKVDPRQPPTPNSTTPNLGVGVLGVGSFGGDTRRAKSDQFAQELYYQDADFEIADRCAQLAGHRGVSPAQIALAWLLHKPGVTAPIFGATKLEQLDQAVAATAVRLHVDEIRFLEERYQPHPVLGHEFTAVVTARA